MKTQLFIAFATIVFTLSVFFVPSPIWLRACYIIGAIVGWLYVASFFFH